MGAFDETRSGSDNVLTVDDVAGDAALERRAVVGAYRIHRHPHVFLIGGMVLPL